MSTPELEDELPAAWDLEFSQIERRWWLNAAGLGRAQSEYLSRTARLRWCDLGPAEHGALIETALTVCDFAARVMPRPAGALWRFSMRLS